MIDLKIVRASRPVRAKNSVLLITGDGSRLERDLQEFFEWEIPHDAMCIGRSIKVYPFHVEHYVDVDADAGKWVLENLVKNHPDKGNPVKHTLGEVEWVDACWDSDDIEIPPEDVRWHGSTALFGVLIGLAMGYGCIILAGCPMDKCGHWYFSQQKGEPNWQYSDIAAWLEFKKHTCSTIVKSISGYTAVILGQPTKDWIIWVLSLQSNRPK